MLYKQLPTAGNHQPAIKLSDLIRQELAKRGLVSYADSARFLGMNLEFIRMILHKNHVPKDKNLIKIAKSLGIDATPLILAAHRQRLPLDTHSFILQPDEGTTKNKRIWPLSREQCDYLAKFMSPQEIQLLRKYRQLLPEEQRQTEGYVHYMFSTKRVPPQSSDHQLSS